MSSLRAAHLGPIVGHTTDTTARIWIRGAVSSELEDTTNERRSVGVIAITHENGKKLGKNDRRVYYFRLRREYDRTGTFTLGEEEGLNNESSRPLKPETEYCVRVATLNLDDASPEEASAPHKYLAKRLPDANVWFDELCGMEPAVSEARFVTFPATGGGHQPLRFILGSCRYPGLFWKIKLSDAIFGPLLEEAKGRSGREPVNMQLMVGDQIYADMLNRNVPISRADTFAEFQDRYHKAFGSRNMRSLLRQLPTYMILDDHEIEDNWCQDRIRSADSRAVFHMAMDTYRSYQWLHSPSSYGERLYYEFTCADYPFFVLDTRTQRYMDDVRNSLDDNHLLGRPSLSEEEPSQLDLLLKWLEQSQHDHGDRPKFIVSSSVFTPNPIDARSGRGGSDLDKVRWSEATDSWPAFPQTRQEILAFIVAGRIQNVVFLSGDIHCSNVCEMSFSGHKDATGLKAFSVTSSAFYWPFPFADGEPSSFVHDSKAEGQEDTFNFKVGDQSMAMDYKAWNFTQDDNFSRVDIDPGTHQMTVSVFDKQGELVRAGNWFRRDGKELIATLQLAPW